MELIIKYNKEFAFISVCDTFSIYLWVAPLKDKKGIKITKAFQYFLDESNHELNKI